MARELKVVGFRPASRDLSYELERERRKREYWEDRAMKLRLEKQRQIARRNEKYERQLQKDKRDAECAHERVKAAMAFMAIYTVIIAWVSILAANAK